MIDKHVTALCGWATAGGMVAASILLFFDERLGAGLFGFALGQVPWLVKRGLDGKA